jgi:hypothetical protein
MTSRPMWWLITGTPVFVLLAHYAADLPHEFMHSLAAWSTGIKVDPWDIHWGEGSVGNALLLYDIDEKIDYLAAYTDGRGPPLRSP